MAHRPSFQLRQGVQVGLGSRTQHHWPSSRPSPTRRNVYFSIWRLLHVLTDCGSLSGMVLLVSPAKDLRQVTCHACCLMHFGHFWKSRAS
ncbi:putative basic proline-rich protein-like [Iris pallida]|uniref:Basic proline-rich protein-like n=1 Tax=Iris pallida TaxID=29817 RepID=A0AAX6G862_IRIPA|nr:putative basic proline-rich protein-like [Iris pallida]